MSGSLRAGSWVWGPEYRLSTGIPQGPRARRRDPACRSLPRHFQANKCWRTRTESQKVRMVSGGLSTCWPYGVPHRRRFSPGRGRYRSRGKASERPGLNFPPWATWETSTVQPTRDGNWSYSHGRRSRTRSALISSAYLRRWQGSCMATDAGAPVHSCISCLSPLSRIRGPLVRSVRPELLPLNLREMTMLSR